MVSRKPEDENDLDSDEKLRDRDFASWLYDNGAVEEDITVFKHFPVFKRIETPRASKTKRKSKTTSAPLAAERIKKYRPKRKT